MRKCCIDPDGKKTNIRKRGWNMLFLGISDMVLYCFKDENNLYINGKLDNAIKLHHAFAEIASEYTKKQFVFRLYTADQVIVFCNQFAMSDYKDISLFSFEMNNSDISYHLGTIPFQNTKRRTTLNVDRCNQLCRSKIFCSSTTCSHLFKC